MRPTAVTKPICVAIATLVLSSAMSVAPPALALSGSVAGSPGLQMFTDQLPIPPEIDARRGGAFGLDELVGTHVFGSLDGGQKLGPTGSFGFWPSGMPSPASMGLADSFPYLGPTIEAQRGKPISMTVTNRLYEQGVDPSAPPECQALGLRIVHPLAAYFDTTIEGTQLLDQCAPATATHLHGGHTSIAFDGDPMDTYRAAVAGDPDDYAAGTGSFTYKYINDQESTTLWYHDHALADTRFNPMAGLAAFYLVRDQWDTGRAGNALGLPANTTFVSLGKTNGDRLPIVQPVNPYEIPVVLQDRKFNSDGTLAYPTQTTVDHPLWAPESFGDVSIVNGKAWPNLNVDRGLYRLRLLNGSNARFYSLRLVDAQTARPAAAPVYVIGSDGGLLNFSVPVSALPGGELLIAPGERFDLLVDFRNSKPGATYRWANSAAAPYPDGDDVAIPQIMQFTVGRQRGFNGSVPAILRGLPGRPPLVLGIGPRISQNRTMFLNEVLDEADSPLDVLLNNLDFMEEGQMRSQGIEHPKVNTVEVWTIVNTTGDAHPIHLHAVQFRVLTRQNVDAAGYLAAVNPALPYGAGGTGVQGSGGLTPAPDPGPYLIGAPTAPLLDELGWKDTVKVYPGQLVRIVVAFGGSAAGIHAPFTGDPIRGVQHFTGTYVWHCHILEHEENDMMLPYTIEP